jgi:hypothetical protein
MLKLLKDFENIISSFTILTYEREETVSRLKLEIVFIDKSKLYVRDYYFGDAKRKYVFHWMDKQGRLIMRGIMPSIGPTFPLSLTTDTSVAKKMWRLRKTCFWKKFWNS